MFLSACDTKLLLLSSPNFINANFSNVSGSGSIDYSKFCTLVRDRYSSSDSAALEEILTCQNTGVMFDSLGRIKDLLGSNYVGNSKSLSLALDRHKFERPITVSTSANRLPEVLNVKIGDILPLLNMSGMRKLPLDTNKILILIVPKYADKKYIRKLKEANWHDAIERNRYSFFFIVK
ncbi:MAG: hypothetical protein RL660_785 [Bacteroidota bacterium]|jgi:hypothetical protein